MKSDLFGQAFLEFSCLYHQSLKVAFLSSWAGLCRNQISLIFVCMNYFGFVRWKGSAHCQRYHNHSDCEISC